MADAVQRGRVDPERGRVGKAKDASRRAKCRPRLRANSRRRPMVASRLASLCVAWTIALACLKYLAVPLFSHPTTAAAATTAAREPQAREQCLDTVVREMLLRVDAKLSAPRQAALLFLAELVLRERVRGDFLEYGSADGGTAALLFAVMMCDGDAGRRLWTFGDWRDELQRWAAVWQPRPGLAWDSARLLRLAPPAQPGRVALLVCGGPTYRDTESCLRHAPAVTRGGIVFVSEYWKHDGSRSAADSSRGALRIGTPLFAVGEEARPTLGWRRDEPAGTLASWRWADLVRVQRFAANVSEGDALLQRSDKCCGVASYDAAAACCRPHAAFWQIA